MPLYTTSHHTRRHHVSHTLSGRLSRLESKIPVPESKWYDTSLAGTSISSTALITPLDGIAQGVTQSTRVGDSIKASSLFIRYSLSRVAGDSFCRIIHFIWKSNDVPTVAQVLQTASYISPLNRDFGFNIRVLQDRLYTLASGESALQVEKIAKKLWYTNRYDSDAVTTTSMNGLYSLMISDKVAAGGLEPVITYYARLSYKDS